MSAKKPLEPGDPRHGTLSGYNFYKCRCTPCKAARSEYFRAHRENLRAKGLPPGDPRHGSLSGYSNYYCRCEICREVHAEAERARRLENHEKGLVTGRSQHGTTNGYVNYGCRCEQCTEANSAQSAKWQRNNPDKARATSVRRAGLLQAAKVEDVDFAVIIERAQGNCRLCSLPVDFEAEARSRTSPTLEHLTPIVRGGEHSYANCDLAHWSCNSSKNDLTLAEFEEREAAKPFSQTCFALMARELGMSSLLEVSA